MQKGVHRLRKERISKRMGEHVTKAINTWNDLGKLMMSEDERVDFEEKDEHPSFLDVSIVD